MLGGVGNVSIVPRDGGLCPNTGALSAPPVVPGKDPAGKEHGADSWHFAASSRRRGGKAGWGLFSVRTGRASL